MPCISVPGRRDEWLWCCQGGRNSYGCRFVSVAADCVRFAGADKPSRMQLRKADARDYGNQRTSQYRVANSLPGVLLLHVLESDPIFAMFPHIARHRGPLATLHASEPCSSGDFDQDRCQQIVWGETTLDIGVGSAAKARSSVDDDERLAVRISVAGGCGCRRRRCRGCVC
jgi:hypothetical protein